MSREWEIREARLVSKESSRVIHNILFPTVNIYGPCYFNKNLEEKCKEEYAFGIFWNQFEEISTKFDSK